ncbi:hypothetical protein CHS0354_030701 [Potamilus streckersoni]|uniref:Uncharacterized protein n=1 Tax=Potamilus streckersoni TaxID=2493646 RepID=A0AAE0SMV1_9BIVA|nr:hypothetical protein CHS0354_030701 [Potamilus streckersoni]
MMMAHVLLCTRVKDTILDFQIFSHGLAPTCIEYTNVLVRIYDHDVQQDMFFFVQHEPVSIIYNNQTIQQPNNNKKNVSYVRRSSVDLFDEAALECCQRKVFDILFRVSLIPVLPSLKCNVDIDAHLAALIFKHFMTSAVFRRRFIKLIKQWLQFETALDMDLVTKIGNIYSVVLYVPYLIDIRVKGPKLHLSVGWCKRIECLVQKRVYMEELMAWLSTLGGAFSSMGDYFDHFAEMAGKISLKQLKVAIEMGNPMVASRCRLFYAQSLMQRGKLRQSKTIIRSESRFASQHNTNDQQVIRICQALWSKLRYLYTCRKKNR